MKVVSCFEWRVVECGCGRKRRLRLGEQVVGRLASVHVFLGRPACGDCSLSLFAIHDSI